MRRVVLLVAVTLALVLTGMVLVPRGPCRQAALFAVVDKTPDAGFARDEARPTDCAYEAGSYLSGVGVVALLGAAWTVVGLALTRARKGRVGGDR